MRRETEAVFTLMEFQFNIVYAILKPSSNHAQKLIHFLALLNHGCLKLIYPLSLCKTEVTNVTTKLELQACVNSKFKSNARLHTIPNFSSGHSVYLENSSSSGSLSHKLLILGFSTHDLEFSVFHSYEKRTMLGEISQHQFSKCFKIGVSNSKIGSCDRYIIIS